MKYWYIAYLTICSLIAYLLYGIDKNKAKKGKWRISEKALLGIGFLGGALGATLGMTAFRHKTKHWYFKAVNALGLIWQVALLIYLC